MTKDMMIKDLKAVSVRFFKENPGAQYVTEAGYKKLGGKYRSSVFHPHFRGWKDFLKSVKKQSPEAVIQEDIQRVAKKFFALNPKDTCLSRDFFRENKSQEYHESEAIALYGTFKKLSKHFKNPNLVTRNDFVRETINKKHETTFVVSALVAGAPINKPFLQSLQNYCKFNRAELILLGMRGVKNSDEFEREVLESLNVHTRFVFNDNLVAMDFKDHPQQIRPTEGLRRFGQGKHSLIVASTKQWLTTESAGIGVHPHIVMSTGTICEPAYSPNRRGAIGEQDNLLGALVIEVKDSKTFYWRHIQADSWGGFNSLNKYYSQSNVKPSRPVGLILEPHWGEEDEDAILAAKDMVNYLNPHTIFMHDCFDFSSISHHDKDFMIKAFYKKEHQHSLKQELDYVGKKLEEWSKQFPKQTIHIVPSNHDDFLERYLHKGDFRGTSPDSVKICYQLSQYLCERKNPKEVYLKSKFHIPNVSFGDLNQSVQISGCEMNCHGHKGMSGARGSITGMERRFHTAFVGHFHSPQIMRDIYVIGCQCKLQQEYTRGSGSNWAHAAGVIYDNGNRQLLLSIGRDWK